MAARITGIAGSEWSDLYICYFLVLRLNGAFHFIIVFFFNFIRHVSLNLNYGNSGKEISLLKLQWKHLIKKAVNCHFCSAGWASKEKRETCRLWAERAPGKAGPVCQVLWNRSPYQGPLKGSWGLTDFFSIKRPISGLSKELREKRSIVLHSCLVSLPSDQPDSRSKQAISAWMSLPQSPSTAWSDGDVYWNYSTLGFSEGRKVCAGE